MGPHPIHIVRGPAFVDPQVPAFGPAQLTKFLSECCDARLHFRITLCPRHQHTDAPHPLALLRAHRQRPGSCRAAEKGDELASLHSITSSARSKNDSGIVRPSALAVVRFMTRSNLVGCSTGMSPGFAPRRILSTKSAARLHMRGQFGP